MSLNKSLDRLFNEIRREARRNPEFADRLDAILRTHDSRRDVADEVIEAVEAEEESAPAVPAPAPPPPATKPKKRAAAPPPDINPVGLFQRGGEDALEEALISHNRDALLALIAEHNLDPGGEAAALSRDDLQAHVVAAAKRRAERDKKLFDY
ncbi:MAG: hypothetical protein AB7T08_03330 [Hyphomonadaceae bacterium]